jgi:hypothetical protein
MLTIKNWEGVLQVGVDAAGDRLAGGGPVTSGAGIYATL